MIPDIVEIKRLCASGQWIAKVENGKIFLHDTVAGETVCIGNAEVAPVRHGRWIRMDETFARWQCSACGAKNHRICWTYCPNCGAKMDGGTRDVE